MLIPLAWHGLHKNWFLLLKNWKLVLGLAITGIVLQNSMIYFAARTADPFNMSLLALNGPIFLLVLSLIFLHEHISLMQIIGFIIALGGVIFIITQGNISKLLNFNFAPGDLFVLFNSFCFAIYSLLQKKRPSEINQQTMLAATAFVGVILLYPIAFIEVGENIFSKLNTQDWLILAYLGIFNSVGAYLMWNNALAKIGNLKTGIIYYLLPFFSGIEAFLFLGERFYPSQILGGLFVISGIMMVSFGHRQTTS